FSTSPTYDQAKLRITSMATGTVFTNVDIPAPLSGTVNWNGELVAGSGAYLPPGEYRADIEVLKRGHSLGRSSSVNFTAFGVALDVAGIPAANKWDPGAPFTVGGAARSVTVSVTPTPSNGDLTLSTVGTAGTFEFKDGANVITPDVAGGTVFP